MLLEENLGIFNVAKGIIDKKIFEQNSVIFSKVKFIKSKIKFEMHIRLQM